MCSYTKGIVGTNREDQLKNPEIKLLSNAIQYLQEDYYLIRNNTYKLQEYFRFRACYKDHPECILQLNICNSKSDSENKIESFGSGQERASYYDNDNEDGDDHENWRSGTMDDIAGGYSDTEPVGGEVLSSGDINIVHYTKFNTVTNTKNILTYALNAIQIVTLCRPRNFLIPITTNTTPTNTNIPTTSIPHNDDLVTDSRYNIRFFFSSAISTATRCNIQITILITVVLLLL